MQTISNDVNEHDPQRDNLSTREEMHSGLEARKGLRGGLRFGVLIARQTSPSTPVVLSMQRPSGAIPRLPLITPAPLRRRYANHPHVHIQSLLSLPFEPGATSHHRHTLIHHPLSHPKIFIHPVLELFAVRYFVRVESGAAG